MKRIFRETNKENLDKKGTYMVFTDRNTYIFINA
jgi:hypothetical protein